MFTSCRHFCVSVILVTNCLSAYSDKLYFVVGSPFWKELLKVAATAASLTNFFSLIFRYVSEYFGSTYFPNSFLEFVASRVMKRPVQAVEDRKL